MDQVRPGKTEKEIQTILTLTLAQGRTDLALDSGGRGRRGNNKIIRISLKLIISKQHSL